MAKQEPRPGLVPLSIKGAYAVPRVLEEFESKDQPDGLGERVLRMLPRNLTWVEPQLSVQRGRRNALNTNWAGGVVLAGAFAPQPGAASSLTGFATGFDGQQHVMFIGADAHVYELAYITMQWVFRDLTALAGAPNAVVGSALAGYSTEYSHQPHVVYVGTDQHLHELFFDNGWRHSDLTNAAGAAAFPPIAGTALAGFVSGFNEQQHVIYQGTDARVHELMFDGGWHHADLSALGVATGALPRARSPLAGVATEFNQQLHVYYIDEGGLVHELMYDTHWNHANLTFASGAANSPAAAGSMLAAYVTGFNQQQHVVYISFDSHVHELMFDGGWHHAHLHAAAAAAAFPAAAGSTLGGYATPSNQQQHVNYIGTDAHVHELFFDDGWRHNDLTKLAAASGAPNVPASTPLVGYATDYNGQQHVICIDTANNVQELWFQNDWNGTNLTAAAVSVGQVVPWITALGSWKIPTVSEPNVAAGEDGGWKSSSWVGIDGQNSNDVLQAGVRQSVDDDGEASYYAWIEWYAPEQEGSPDYIHETRVENLPVEPGHQMFCLVRYVENQTKGSLLLVNQSTGHFTSVTLDPPPGAAFLGNTIEWIMEAPDSGPPKTSLPRFDRVVFDPAFGVDLGGSLGNPQKGVTATIFREGTALTTTALASDRVTIDYLPWHAGDPTSLSGAPNVAVLSSLAGYSTAFNEQQHIAFIATDGHIHELLFDHGWSQNDLTVNASALGAPPRAGSALAGYSTEFNSQQHVIYIGTDQHVHELVFDDGWHHTDLTTAAGAAAFLPLGNTALAGYVSGFNEQQHVIYQGTDNHVHELMYDGSWHHADLSVLAGAVGALPRAASALAGFATEFNRQQHVFYIDQGGLIHELMFGDSWQHTNLTFVSGAANSPAGMGSMLAGYVTGFNEQQHVVYIAFDNHVHELMFDGGWHHNDITAAAGAAAFLPIAGSALDGYSTEFNQQQHVNYIGADSHVHELFFDSIWKHNDLTVQSAAPAIRAGTPLVGYATSFNGQQHVIYIGANNHVQEVWF